MMDEPNQVQQVSLQEVLLANLKFTALQDIREALRDLTTCEIEKTHKCQNIIKALDATIKKYNL